jgi:hypothetical protein
MMANKKVVFLEEKKSDMMFMIKIWGVTTRVLRRFSGIQAEFCAVFVGCTVTCLRGF